MAHTISDKTKFLARVRRIQGQTEGLEKMLDDQGECAAILQQIAAIRGAVNGLMLAVMEEHLTDHIVLAPTQGQRERDLDAVLQVLKSYLK
jgi:DNA-binding FrmR family transcriptional regulator